MSRPEEINKRFLRTLIRRYYRERPLEEPPELHKREIALESLEDNAYIRHLSFPYMDDLYEFILNKKTPLHLYYSSAIYENPAAEDMGSKGWLGSELIFDIDADKFPGCSNELYICAKTGDILASKDARCPDGSEPIKYSSLPWKCLEIAWGEALKLIDILRDELGFRYIEAYFSGNRGFHVRVIDEEVLRLGRDERRLLADYISCGGLDPEKAFPRYRDKLLFIEEEYGIRKRALEFLKSRGALVRAKIGGLLFQTAPLDMLEEVLNSVCIKIDKAVTMDISRLSRFHGSLNMKAGLRVTRIDVEKGLEGMGYELLTPFRGKLLIKSLVTAFNLPLFDEVISLSRGEEISIEAYKGIYLVVKGLAVIRRYEEVEVVK